MWVTCMEGQSPEGNVQTYDLVHAARTSLCRQFWTRVTQTLVKYRFKEAATTRTVRQLKKEKGIFFPETAGAPEQRNEVWSFKTRTSLTASNTVQSLKDMRLKQFVAASRKEVKSRITCLRNTFATVVAAAALSVPC